MESLYRTPDDYLLASLQRLQDLGSAITDFTGGSTARTFYEGSAAQLSLQSQVLEQLRQDSYLATATGDALDAKADDYQVARKAAVPAAGTIRLTRTSTGTAVTIPAGWGPLLTPPTPGQTPVAFVSTEDAVFGTGDTFKVVAAQAVEGGAAGNIAINTKLLPQNPVNGFETDGGFKAEIAFTGGVDAETDDQLRARVPIEVQGRVKGKSEALLAAALRVPGVTSASVLEAGDTRVPGGGTVAAGHCEVYYKGSASLQAQVESEVQASRVAGQDVLVTGATSVQLVIDLQVFCLAGVDHALLSAAVKAAIMAAGNAVGVDEVLRSSGLAKAVHDVPDVISVALPFADLRKTTDPDGTFGDVTCGNTAYPLIADTDIAVTITDLT